MLEREERKCASMHCPPIRLREMAVVSAQPSEIGVTTVPLPPQSRTMPEVLPEAKQVKTASFEINNAGALNFSNINSHILTRVRDTARERVRERRC
jgi:hypothetical protein